MVALCWGNGVEGHTSVEVGDREGVRMSDLTSWGALVIVLRGE